VAAVGDDRQQDVVALLDPPCAGLDLRDPLGEELLVVAERDARFGGDELTLATLDPRQVQTEPSRVSRRL
jgi:hypothetical protein